MAYKSLYQIPNIPRLYVSYPLWQYANGGLNYIYPDELLEENSETGGIYPGNIDVQYRGLKKEDMISIIKFYENQRQYEAQPETIDGGEAFFGWQTLDRPTYRTDENNNPWHTGQMGYNRLGANFGIHHWDFNYAMILNHNFGEEFNWAFNFYQIRGTHRNDLAGDGWSENYNLEHQAFSNLFNSPFQDSPELNGTSIIRLRNMNSNYQLGMGLKIYSTDDNMALQSTSGLPRFSSVLWGKMFDFHNAVNSDIKLTYKYDNTTRTNIYGNSISTSKWNRIDGWYGYDKRTPEPFGTKAGYFNIINNQYLTGDNVELYDHSSSHRRKSGIRSWEMSFDFMDPSSHTRLLNQLPMLNQNAWWSGPGGPSSTETFDEFSNTTTGVEGSFISEMNIEHAGYDFYTNVIHKTNGGELPMILQLDKDDPSSQGLAIVRMTKYNMTRTGFNTYSISLTLEEQV